MYDEVKIARRDGDSEIKEGVRILEFRACRVLISGVAYASTNISVYEIQRKS